MLLATHDIDVALRAREHDCGLRILIIFFSKKHPTPGRRTKTPSLAALRFRLYALQLA